eukprot:CAMPEP_0174705936 /NCGR_PEP_ID=MMETSP1094-20130205/8972_1 /TAXON_ID=156173 /ORGANISM="Chrysochromulina brevifilum, Strain UTEX LB 985" /LENGTH=155 /DNA_ID=CAMNT_0015904155 /DNA_START=168 /DNA_END=635 /DNA_ORIENTATION=-
MLSVNQSHHSINQCWAGPPELTQHSCYVDKGGGAKFVSSNGDFIHLKRGETAAEGEKVLRGVYFQSSGAFLKCAMGDPDGPALRAFLGYAGWGPQQLDGEWRRGSWTLCDASAEAVFTSDVAGLWSQMSTGSMGLRLCSRVSQAQPGERWNELKA